MILCSRCGGRMFLEPWDSLTRERVWKCLACGRGNAPKPDLSWLQGTTASYEWSLRNTRRDAPRPRGKKVPA